MKREARALGRRQMKVLDKWAESWEGKKMLSRGYIPYDDLPADLVAQLERIKDTETLWSDTERYLGDLAMKQRYGSEVTTKKRLGGEFTEEEWKTHQKKHPDAEKGDHTITKTKGKKAPEKAKKDPARNLTKEDLFTLYETAGTSLGGGDFFLQEVEKDGTIIYEYEGDEEIDAESLSKKLKNNGIHGDVSIDSDENGTVVKVDLQGPQPVLQKSGEGGGFAMIDWKHASAADEMNKVARELVAVAKDLLAAEGDACGTEGCIRKVGDKWGIMSGKTGKMWPSHYDSKEEAEDVLKRYHGRGF